MTLILYLLAFLLLITIVVFIHELGHFLLARAFGVKVLDFSLGFGKSVKTWSSSSGTEYNLRILPIGGYVQMLGEDNDFNKRDSFVEDSFQSKKYYQKLLITLGGPIFNFFLALIIFFGINLYGIFSIVPLIGNVSLLSQADEAGFKSGDLIKQIDGRKVESMSDLQIKLSSRLGETGELKFLVERENKDLQLIVPIKKWLSNEEPKDLLFSLGLGLPLEPIIGSILPDSAASKAGIKSGDLVREIDDLKINYWSDIKLAADRSNGKTSVFKVFRENQLIDLPIKPSISEDGLRWVYGVTPANRIMDELRFVKRFDIANSVLNAVNQTTEITLSSLSFLYKMIFGQISVKNLGGPVMIGQFAGDSLIYGGLYSFIYLIAFISISLGIVNLFPIPVLDGGQALILTIERVMGKQIPPRIIDFVYRLGIIFLAFIFLFVFFNDIFRIITP